MNYSLRSLILVTIQFLAIFAIVLSGSIFAKTTLYLLLELVGIGIGLWALLTMQRSTFSIMPDVKKTGRLVRQGPYRWIRHPMYLAVLLVTGALTLDMPSILRVTIWIVLLVDILFKILHEERMLSISYSEYTQYRTQTKRLLPYLY